MSDAVILEIVKTAGIIAVAILSTIGVILGRKSIKDTKELSVKVDGRLTQLLEETKKSYELAGHKAGVAEQKLEASITTPIELKIPKLEVELKPPPKE